MHSCRTIPLKNRKYERDYQYIYYRETHLTKTQEYYRKYYQKNKKKLNNRTKEWKANHHICWMKYQHKYQHKYRIKNHKYLTKYNHEYYKNHKQ